MSRTIAILTQVTNATRHSPLRFFVDEEQLIIPF